MPQRTAVFGNLFVIGIYIILSHLVGDNGQIRDYLPAVGRAYFLHLGAVLYHYLSALCGTFRL